jgi:hypothetical protein
MARPCQVTDRHDGDWCPILLISEAQTSRPKTAPYMETAGPVSGWGTESNRAYLASFSVKPMEWTNKRARPQIFVYQKNVNKKIAENREIASLIFEESYGNPERWKL